MAKRPARKRPAPSKAPQPRRGRKSPRARRKAAPGASPEADAAGIARKARYQGAVRLYEQGLEALQRRAFAAAATHLRQVIEDYPDERELHERCQLYLKICARKSEPQAPPPKTLEERTYAATLALNARSIDEALRHLEAASNQEPDSSQVQYMLAVARALGGEAEMAIGHLQRAIELNPDYRLLACQETDFDTLHDNNGFQQAVALSTELPSRRQTP